MTDVGRHYRYKRMGRKRILALVALSSFLWEFSGFYFILIIYVCPCLYNIFGA